MDMLNTCAQQVADRCADPVAPKATKHRVTILDTNESYECSEDEHLLAAMVHIGRRGIPSGCHGGGCGVCKVKIEQGTYHAIKMSRGHVTEEEERNGIVLACRVFPRSAITLKVMGLMSKAFNRPVKKSFGLV